jgi:hypothetical protein
MSDGRIPAGIVIGFVIVIDGFNPVEHSTRKPNPIRIPMRGVMNAGIVIGFVIVIAIDGCDRVSIRPGNRYRYR